MRCGRRYTAAKSLILAMDVLVDSQGNYLVAGASGSFEAENRDVYVLKLSAEGNIFWEELYGHHGDYLSYEWGNDIIETSDGGYLVAGNSNAALGGSTGELMNMYLVRIDAQGNLLWEEFAGRGQFYDYGNAVVELPGGDFLVAGTSKTRSNNNEIYIARINAQGAAQDGSTFGDFGSEWGSAITLTPSGEIVLAGQTNSFGAGSFDALLLLPVAAGCRSQGSPVVVIRRARSIRLPHATGNGYPCAKRHSPTAQRVPAAQRTPLPTLSGSGGGVLALARQEGEQRDIYLVNADGSGQHQITRSNQVDEQCPRGNRDHSFQEKK